MPGHSVSLTVGLAALALQMSACCSPCTRPRCADVVQAAPPPAAATAALVQPRVTVVPSADGTRRLLVETVLRRRDGNDETVQVHARVDPWADDLILDRARLEGVPEGTPPALPTLGPQFMILRRSDGHLVADGIPIPAGAARFDHRIVEVDIGVVGRWRVERVRLTGPGSEESVRCGPFILSAKGESESITVLAGSWGEDGERDWRAWHDRVPLVGFGHRWISDGGLIATDSKGARLWTMSGGGTGGATTLTFHNHFQDVNADSVMPAPGFAWPVTLEVRIPEEVRTTTLRFDLTGLAVPR